MKNGKKLVVVVLSLLAAICPPLFAQAKYYKDYGRGYSGYAYAMYLDNKCTGSLEKMHYNITSYRAGSVVDKLTNEESFLLWNALCEYDYRVGEVYHVTVGHRPVIIAITAEITGKDTCSYFATYVLSY